MRIKSKVTNPSETIHQMIVALLAQFVVALAINRYVSPDGSDAGSNCTDVMQPCQTIGAANAVARNGDSIVVMPGQFVEQPMVVAVDISIVANNTYSRTAVIFPAQLPVNSTMPASLFLLADNVTRCVFGCVCAIPSFLSHTHFIDATVSNSSACIFATSTSLQC